MMRALHVILPVVALSLFLMPAKAVAELPDEGSGQMVVDEVCEGLRQYRKEADWEKSRTLLQKLAPTRDPRVAVVLVEDMFKSEQRFATCFLLLVEHYVPGGLNPSSADQMMDWWKKNEADLRHQAEKLPQ
jgi:hypothetical protein